MEHKPNVPLIKAYSYRRFSSSAQSEGVSLRRQIDKAERFAKEKGLELDTELTLEDLGVSAFQGKNRTEGALATFIKGVEEGRVARGSYLLVENLDRLSREQVSKAYHLFTTILHQGIHIATLTDGRVYTSESIDRDFASILVSLTTLYRANEESEVKSQRLRAAWAAKRKSANEKKLTKWCPQWLRLKDDRSEYEIEEDKAFVVRRIFDLYLSGMGKMAIAAQLNAEGIEPIGRSNGWHHSYITKIISNSAVIGQFQPHTTEVAEGKRRNKSVGQVIEDYYPSVVEKSVFYRAQRQREGRDLSRGRRGQNFANLFRGIAKCGVCGGSMNYISKGRRWKTSVRPNAYLQCTNARRKLSNCDHTTLWPYHAVEYFLTEGISDVDFSSLFPAMSAVGREELTRAEADNAIAVGELEDVNRNLSNLADVLQERPNSTTLIERLDRLEKRKGELEAYSSRMVLAVETATEKLRTVQYRFDTQDELLKGWRTNCQRRSKNTSQAGVKMHHLA